MDEDSKMRLNLAILTIRDYCKEHINNSCEGCILDDDFCSTFGIRPYADEWEPLE